MSAAGDRSRTDPTPRRLPVAAGAALLLLAYFALATSAVREKSNTFDEIAHLTAGYAYWTLDDYRLHPENGNWPQRLGALPALLAPLRFPSLDDAGWRESDAYAVGDQFFFGAGNDIDRVLWQGRATIALLGVALGAIVFAWSRRLNGAPGSWISLVLFVLSPTMLAHGALVTSDMAAALAFTVAAGAWWVLLHRVTPVTAAASVLAAAALFLSKFSAPIVVPIVAALAGLRVIAGGPLAVEAGRRVASIAGRGRQTVALLILAGLHAVVVVALIWASFGFRFTAFHPERPGDRLLVEWGTLLSEPDTGKPGVTERAVGWARGNRLLPEAYLYGFAHSVRFAQSRRAFMAGEYGTEGWRSFFPYAFAIKTTIPLIGLLGLALAAAIVRARRPLNGRPALGYAFAAAPLILLIGVYWVFALATNLNIGHRHLLPVYPALFILAGGAGFWLDRWRFGGKDGPAGRSGRDMPPRRKQKRSAPAPPAPRHRAGRAPAALALLTLGLTGWHALESFAVRPHYLAYFNGLAGGPAQGYRHLVDSSLDWGQDLPGLKLWLDANAGPPSAVPVYLSYFGTARPEHFGLEAILLPGYFDRRESLAPAPLAGGWYCISATMLQGVYLGAPGPWTAAYEAQYQKLAGPALELLRAVETRDRPRVDAMLAARGEAYWVSLLEEYDQLRISRLMAWLRQREPTTMIGYSILVYRLNDADVAEALLGPAPLPVRLSGRGA
jgi:hypothetical protein